MLNCLLEDASEGVSTFVDTSGAPGLKPRAAGGGLSEWPAARLVRRIHSGGSRDMQLRKMTLMLAVLGTMSMVLTGCPDGGRESLACTETADCHRRPKSVIRPPRCACRPVRASVPTAPSRRGGARRSAAANTQKICKCDATANCAADERVDAELVCNTTTGVNVCVTSALRTRTAPRARPATRPRASARAGALAVPACDPATQPGICGYGQICSSTTSKCEAAPRAPAPRPRVRRLGTRRAALLRSSSR